MHAWLACRVYAVKMHNPVCPRLSVVHQPDVLVGLHLRTLGGQVVGYTDYPTLDQIPAGTPTQKHYSGQLIFAAPKEKKPESHEP